MIAIQLEVICPEDCGNAPKKVVLRDFNIAIAKLDIDIIMENITEEIIWDIKGDTRIEGRDRFVEKLHELHHIKPTQLHIDKIITHGNTASANGMLYYANGVVHAFCDVYVFNSHAKNAKIREITSYIIRIENNQS